MSRRAPRKTARTRWARGGRSAGTSGFRVPRTGGPPARRSARAFAAGPALLVALATGAAALTLANLPPRDSAPATPSLPAAGPGLSASNPAPPLPATVQDPPNVPYDGTFTFVRVRFNTTGRGFGWGFGGGRGPGWAHDYPAADENFIRILDEISLIDVNMTGTNVIDADDPELLRYPLAYVSEPGEWTPTQAEVDNLSDYLLKGGFLILDDFRSDFEWSRVEEIFAQIVPGHEFRVLDIEEPIFDSFFEIESLDLPPPTFQQFWPVFLGMHENNDPDGRLMIIANFNNDIGDYWEYSDRGYVPIELSNEAYKFGVNYVIYAMNR